MRAWWLSLLALGGCDPSLFNGLDDGGEPRADQRIADSTLGDGEVPDAALPDATPIDAGPDAAPVDLDPCGLPAVDPDAPRTVLIGHRFGLAPGESGSTVRSLVLRSDGALVDVGARLDVGDTPAQIAVAPHGRLALVAGEEGTVTVVDIQDPADLQIVDVTTVPRAGINDLVFDPSGQMAFLLRSDVDEATAGVYTLHLACDGTITVAEQHFGLRLAQSLALLPDDPDRAVILGGQATFEPEDPNDVRLLTRDGDTWAEVEVFDIYSDLVGASGIAVGADGTVLVPNSLPFSDEGGQVAVLRLEGDALRETRRLEGLNEAELVLIAPDAETAVLLRPAVDTLTVLDGTNGWRATADINIGLAVDLGMVRTGDAAGMTLAPSVLPGGGARVTVFDVSAGRAAEIDRVELGGGNENVPGPIGVRP